MGERENADAARQRADFARALREEREECERAGKTARVKAIDAELRRVTGEPKGRRAPGASKS